jgi:hypothetical protein
MSGTVGNDDYATDVANRKALKRQKIEAGRPGFIGWIMLLGFFAYGISNPWPFGWLLAAVCVFAFVVTIVRKVRFAQQVHEINNPSRAATRAIAPQAAAGWYADPWQQAELRWFDGTAWTGHTHTAL